MKNILLILIVVAVIVGIGTLGAGCGNQIPPTGGPRDSLPPILLSAIPKDSSLNFQEKKIVFTFDEYVMLDNIQKNLLVSPTLPSNPIVVHRLKTVTVTINDTVLQPNTTYTLDFGKGIKDNNEGNVYQNFKYIFSTGSYLDSLGFNGRIINAETGLPDSTLTATLYKNSEDSAIIKEKPLYMSRLNGKGEFSFSNLPPGVFYLYAFKDESGIGRYQGKTQPFAFAPEPVLLNSDSILPAITLYAFIEEKETKQPAPSGRPGRRASEEDQASLIYTHNLKENKLSLLEPLKIIFTDSVVSLNTNGIVLSDTGFVPVPVQDMQLDSTGKLLTIQADFPQDTEYRLVLHENFATDTAGLTQLNNDTLNFTTRKTSEYGTLRMRFLNINLNRNPILLLLQNNEIKYTHIFVNREMLIPLFEPGDYDLRIVYDENKNGKWDTGSFFEEKRQPEKVLPINRKITIRANWENEIDIDLSNN